MTESTRTERIYLSPPHMSGKEMDLIRQVFESNYIAPLGPMVDRFEKEFSERVNIPHALAVSSGTAAMHLALHHIGVGKGDIVLVSSLTFIGSVSPAVFRGAAPVFIDSDRTSWNMNPDLLEEEIETCRVKGRLPTCITPTDLYGQTCDLDRITEICGRYGIPVIADCAESLGATYKGRSAGDGASAAIFSFNGNKIITTSGGGMLVSHDADLVRHARFLSQQAREPFPFYEHKEVGYNYRMSNVLAAIGCGQLRVLEERIAKKREIFDYYRQALGELAGIEFMPEAPYGQATRWLTVILIDPKAFGVDREFVRVALAEENIESRPIWKPMHLQPIFKECRIRGGAVSEDLFNRGLCLPSGTQMTEENLERVAETIRRCCKNR